MVHSRYFHNHEKLKEYEKEKGVLGYIEFLKDNGWNSYQWNDETEESLKKYKYQTCFLEVFGDNYNGYIRTDSKKDLEDCFKKAIDIVMKYNKCENTYNGHEFENYKNYENGLMVCKKCGFNGYSSIFKSLNQTIDDYKIHYKITQEHLNSLLSQLNQYGISLTIGNKLKMGKNVLDLKKIDDDFFKELNKLSKKYCRDDL